MTTEENKNEELKEDSQPDKTTLEQDHKVAERKGLGRRDTILLFLPIFFLACIQLLAFLSTSLFKLSLGIIMLQYAFLPLAILYLISLLVSLFILFNKVNKIKSHLLSSVYTILAWVIIGCCPCGVFSPNLLQWHRSEWEIRCKSTLRALGYSQLTFSDSNNLNYGTWQELIDQDFIQGQYTRDNLIEEYTITSFIIYNPSESERALGKSSSFTITAVPKTTKYKMRTFGFGDDQTPYVYVGSADAWSTENVSLHNIELWEPLR